MKKILSAISIIMISLLFISCSKKQEADNTKVGIGYFPNITHSQALVGKTEGQFQKEFDNNEVE